MKSDEIERLFSWFRRKNYFCFGKIKSGKYLYKTAETRKKGQFLEKMAFQLFFFVIYSLGIN